MTKIVRALLCVVHALMLIGFTVSLPATAQTASPARVTILYDAFGKPSPMQRGWGYSALIEYGGKRILFDTGGQYEAFADNVKQLNVDLTHLDFVVLSHRHGDHTSGLAYVLKQNPKVKIYAPLEVGSFGTPTSGSTGKGANRYVAGVPADLHYFDGHSQEAYPVDSAWPGANITLVNKPIEVMPGFFLFRTVSDVVGTLELNELSLGINTPKGMVVVVGCSHPGVEKILGVAETLNPKLYTVVGGLHLLDKPDAQVTQIVENFQTRWKLERVAAGHCSGEFAQSEMQRVFGTRHDHSGLGEMVLLP